MEYIRELFMRFDAFIGNYIDPYLAKLSSYLQNGSNIIISISGVFLVLLALIGLIKWLRKAPKLFFFVVIVFGLIIGAWVITRN